MDADIFMKHRIILLYYFNNLKFPWESGSIVDLFSNYNCVSWINQLIDIFFNSLLLISQKLSCGMLITVSDVFYFTLIKKSALGMIYS